MNLSELRDHFGVSEDRIKEIAKAIKKNGVEATGDLSNVEKELAEWLINEPKKAAGKKAADEMTAAEAIEADNLGE